ncbi:MAG: undecaprenyldiphospho-muramoylpentapeptide beta-N-acetylglucosaminyltransferase [Alphaproteobacteria bacterium]|nr:undecaprenyldiphospho-muramoylpentapeptide beta-N-acetylglucosaminyltransferase [Alphaproteobacteria bacterium]
MAATTAPGRIVLAAGGTGGHVFAAQALAEALLGRGHALALVTDRRGDHYGGSLARLETHRIAAARIDGGIAAKLRGIAELGYGYIQSRRLLARLAPAAVVGFGGYPSVPVMLAATQARRPTLLHEQNAVLGRANRLLAPRVTRIATSFATVLGVRPGDYGRLTMTGNPVRGAIGALSRLPYPTPEASAGVIRILVLGGSQGARALSEVVPVAIARLAAAVRGRIAVAQQCRPEDIERARTIYRQCKAAFEVATFFDDVPRRLAESHLMIGRAGASTCAELTASGRPAILVPYPHATDDHQSANARALEAAGAAWVMAQSTFTAEALAERLAAFVAAPAILAAAAEQARAIGIPEAADRLADAVEEVAGINGHRGGAPVREEAA